MSLGTLEQRLVALPQKEQAARRELLERLAQRVISAPLEEASALVDRIVDSELEQQREDNWTLDEARKRNIERLLADQAQLIRECIPARTLRNGMNVSRQRLHQLVSEGRLVAIQIQDGSPSLFPFWQFDSGMPVRPVAGLNRLLDAARESEMGPVALHFFMVEPNDRLDGQPPHLVFAAGGIDRVVQVLRSVGLEPF
jgi:hypothetical protein